MRVMGQCRTPGVKNQRGADARAEVLRIGCDRQQGLGRHVEQSRPYSTRLVLVRHGAHLAPASVNTTW
jgi:hypothetical protein